MKNLREKQIESLIEAYNAYRLIAFPSPKHQQILDEMLANIKYLIKEQANNGS